MFEILAQTVAPVVPAAPPATTAAPLPPLMEFLRSFGPILLIIIVFYFLVFGSKRKQEKQRQAMLSNIQKGDRVQTIGGILGTVIEARETEVTVKVDESSNTKLKFARSAIHRVMQDDKGDSK